MGPGRAAGGACDAPGEAPVPVTGRRRGRVRRLAAARRRRRLLRRAIRELNRRGVQTVLDSEGLPLRLGVEAEPALVSPNQREAEGLVGQEFRDDEDFVMALHTIADRGVRDVLISLERGALALVRADRVPRRFRAVAPPSRPSRTWGPATSSSQRSSRRGSTARRPATRSERGRLGRRVDAPRRRGALRPARRRAPRQPGVAWTSSRRWRLRRGRRNVVCAAGACWIAPMLRPRSARYARMSGLLSKTSCHRAKRPAHPDDEHP